MSTPTARRVHWTRWLIGVLLIAEIGALAKLLGWDIAGQAKEKQTERKAAHAAKKQAKKDAKLARHTAAQGESEPAGRPAS